MINASRMKLRDAWILGLSVCVPAHWGLAEEPLAPDPGAVCASLQARAHAWESTQKSNPDAARQLALPCSKELAMTAKNCAVFSAATSKCQQRCKPKCRDLGSMTCSACLQETNDDCIEDQQEKIQEITESMEAVYDASQKCRFLDCTLAMRYHSQKRESPYRERCLECEAWALDPLTVNELRATGSYVPPKGIGLRATGGVLLGLGVAALGATIPLAALDGRPTGEMNCVQNGLGNLPCYYSFSQPGWVTGVAAGGVALGVGLALLIPGCIFGCPSPPKTKPPLPTQKPATRMEIQHASQDR